ncbi:MAG: protein phosphatase 2C domain-containing protein [Rhizobiales bacterium]|nr:protein phosphatase 2C domain-containing protein [Hyphomicrobiales bacterium]
MGAVTQPSKENNEDGYGWVGSVANIEAAWVFDGVTGINAENILPGASDARWLVERAGEHLASLASSSLALPEILAALVDRLIGDWQAAITDLHIPPDYDPPAACLVFVKHYADGWKGMRLGDSCLLARSASGDHHVWAASPNNEFDHWLTRATRTWRDRGITDIDALLAEFRPQMAASRNKRNQPGGYSILEADRASLNMPEFFDLPKIDALLLCTDGFYRAVDHYDLYANESLVARCEGWGGVEEVLREVRAIEASDPTCDKYPRFKPADDATAVMLK